MTHHGQVCWMKHGCPKKSSVAVQPIAMRKQPILYIKTNWHTLSTLHVWNLLLLINLNPMHSQLLQQHFHWSQKLDHVQNQVVSLCPQPGKHIACVCYVKLSGFECTLSVSCISLTTKIQVKSWHVHTLGQTCLNMCKTNSFTNALNKLSQSLKTKTPQSVEVWPKLEFPYHPLPMVKHCFAGFCLALLVKQQLPPTCQKPQHQRLTGHHPRC